MLAPENLGLTTTCFNDSSQGATAVKKPLVCSYDHPNNSFGLGRETEQGCPSTVEKRFVITERGRKKKPFRAA